MSYKKKKGFKNFAVQKNNMPKISNNRVELSIKEKKYLNNIFKSSTIALFIIYLSIYKMSSFLSSFEDYNKQYLVIGAITLYYIILVTKSWFYKNFENFKETIYSLLYLFALYNGLVLLNLFGMDEISSKYKVANNAYLLISFIITTANYYIYNIAKITITIIFHLYYLLRDNTRKYLISLIAITFVLYLIVVNFLVIFNGRQIFNMITLFYLAIIAVIITLSILFKCFCIEKIKDISFIKIKENDKINNYKKSFDYYVEKVLAIMKINNIYKLKLINESGKLNIFNTLVISICKIYPLFFFLCLYGSGTYYSIYSLPYKNDCTNLKDQEITKVIELNNNDIIIDKIVNGKKIYITTRCIKENKIVESRLDRY